MKSSLIIIKRQFNCKKKKKTHKQKKKKQKKKNKNKKKSKKPLILRNILWKIIPQKVNFKEFEIISLSGSPFSSTHKLCAHSITMKNRFGFIQSIND